MPQVPELRTEGDRRCNGPIRKALSARAFELNWAVAQRIENGEPFALPGIPASFPIPEALVTDDCIRPPVQS